jgi:plastocyanin
MASAMLSKIPALAALAIVAAAAPAAAATVRVTVTKLTFEPAQVSAHVGDTIEWVNSDFLAHSATGRKKEWDLFIAPNKSGRITLKDAGEIDYYCRFHPNMVGHISVTP